jgi:hypothetical protein
VTRITRGFRTTSVSTTPTASGSGSPCGRPTVREHGSRHESAFGAMATVSAGYPTLARMAAPVVGQHGRASWRLAFRRAF